MPTGSPEKGETQSRDMVRTRRRQAWPRDANSAVAQDSERLPGLTALVTPHFTGSSGRSLTQVLDSWPNAGVAKARPLG